MRHRPVRRWWAPWIRRCKCDWPYYPCPDAAEPAPEPTAEQVSRYLAGKTRAA